MTAAEGIAGFEKKKGQIKPTNTRKEQKPEDGAILAPLILFAVFFGAPSYVALHFIIKFC